MMGTICMRGAFVATLVAWAPLAAAQDAEEAGEEEATSPPPTTLSSALPPAPPEEDDLPIPTLTIDRVPPNVSYEFALHVSYGSVAYFQHAVPSWIGFGFRAGWGKNLGPHRLGAAGTVTAEGDFGVHTLLTVEPTATWDYVSQSGLLLGVGAGPSLLFTHDNATQYTESGFNVAPTVMARVGWSQTWSRVGRRLFVFLEPKARITNEGITPLVALAVGSGGGR